jgi:hypothetical protein
MSLLWLQMTMFWTSEGCSGPKNDYFSKKCAFLGLKRTLFGLRANLLRVQLFQKHFLGPNVINFSLGFGKDGHRNKRQHLMALFCLK